MRRREFIALVGGAAAWPLGLLAQSQTAKRVGVLSPFQPLAGPTHAFDAFKQRMRELEWLDGQNVVFEYRWAEGRADRLPNLASELAGLKLDVFFSAWGTPAALAAKNATTTVPIVFAGVGDAVGVRLVESLARPGGNVTGSTFISEETIAKQLELLKEVVPTSSRMGILVNPSNPVYGPVLKASEVPAKALGVQLQALDVQGQSDFQIAFDSAASAQVGGLVVMRDPIFQINKLWLVELAAKRRLPVIYGMREFAEAGGLMSYGPNLSDMYRGAADVMNKILKGAKPNDVPVQQASRFELLINLKTAKMLGVTIPPSVLALADEVIE